MDGAAARERRSGFRRVAMDATPKIGEHATTLDRRGGPCRGVRPRDGCNRAANRQRGYSERSQRSERRRDQRNKPGLFPACGCPRVRRGKHRSGRLFGEPRLAQAFEDAIGREGWFAEAHSGCVEDRVGDGRRARHRRGFADSERLLLRPRNHQHIDDGEFREGHQRVGSPVARSHRDIGKGDLLLEDAARGLNDVAMNLVTDAFRIDHQSPNPARP